VQRLESIIYEIIRDLKYKIHRRGPIWEAFEYPVKEWAQYNKEWLDFAVNKE
jgi:hypothetical protein